MRCAAVAALVGLLAACTGGTLEGRPTPDSSTAAPVLRASLSLPEEATSVVPDGSAAEMALGASRALFAEAPVVVLAADDEPARVGPSATAAVALGAPLLIAAGGVADELERLGCTDVVVVGDPDDLDLSPGLRVHQVDPADPAALADLGLPVGETQDLEDGGLTAAVAGLDRPRPAVLQAHAEPEPTHAPSASPSNASADDVDPATEPLPLVRLPLPGGSPASPTPTQTPTDTGDPSVWLGEGGATVEPPTAPDGAVVLIDPSAHLGDRAAAAVATARAAGVPVADVPGGDPRVTSATVGALADVRTTIALGSSFGTANRLGPLVATAATGVELPGGGQLVFPDPAVAGTGKRYIALYGTPGTPALGVLGEQDTPATIARAQQTAAPYEALTDDTVIPTLEIIATIASSGPEADGSYSRPRAIEDLRPLVEAAAEAGIPVILDLQPGRTDFVTQAQQFADLLEYPHVGLALDPEWRLKPDQVHLRQIGSVGIDEVNATADWLAQFTRERHLPQKMFLLHQFSLRMIADRERLDTSHDELAMIIHADGQGSQPAKAGTWAALHQGAPEVHWGWKNFYDEDTPMLDPAQTYQVQPTPDLVTYQ